MKLLTTLVVANIFINVMDSVAARVNEDSKKCLGGFRESGHGTIPIPEEFVKQKIIILKKNGDQIKKENMVKNKDKWLEKLYVAKLDAKKLEDENRTDTWGIVTVKIHESSVYFYKRGVLHREDGPAVIAFDSNYGSLNGFGCTSACERWYNNGQLHREDGPAVEYAHGRQEWYKEGKLHREDGPAMVDDGYCSLWFKEGKLHREDGPAIIYNGDREEWYLNGLRHRIDGPAIICPFGFPEKKIPYTKNTRDSSIFRYYKNGQLHREDGHAVEYRDGKKEWYKETKDRRKASYYNKGMLGMLGKLGMLHREDGPAVESPDGKNEWYLNGERYYTPEEFNDALYDLRSVNHQ